MIRYINDSLTGSSRAAAGEDDPFSYDHAAHNLVVPDC